MYRNISKSLRQGSAALILGAMALLSAPAGAQSPTGTSPNTPTAFSWPAFHAGRYEDPLTESNFVNELLGTPTGIFNVPATYPGHPTASVAWTQIPSFLLGNYDPANAPGGYVPADPTFQILNGLAHNFRPNTFSTRNIAYWLAPYAYADVLDSTTTVDDDGANFTVVTGTWSSQSGDATATNTDYHYATATTVVGGSVQWTLTVPATGVYSIVAHLPIGVTLPSTDAAYTIVPGVGAPISVRHSQAGGGTITLLSPIALTQGATLTVTLDNTLNTSTLGSRVYADSISILDATGVAQIVDEDNAHNTGTPYTETGAWTQMDTTTSTVAGSASFSSYRRAAAVNWATAAAATHATANWSYTPTQSGLYQASFHIPNSDTLPFDDATKEFRVTDAHYLVKVTHEGVVHTAVDVRLSQTEANGDTLLGTPFAADAGDTVVVTLTNDTTNILPTGAASTFYVVADTMTLTQTSGAVVDSSPVAVNATEYPDIKNALYYSVLAGTITTPDLNPRGNNTSPFDPASDNTDKTHRIRQLVYFGRNETLYANNGVTTVDDNNTTRFSKTSAWTTVSSGAVVATAKNFEYLTTPLTTTPPITTPTAKAIWNIPVAAGGRYSVNVHLPLAVPNASTNASYSVTYNDGATNQTVNLFRSQAAGGDINLIPDVFIAGASTVTITLYNNDNILPLGSPPGTLVVADSASVASPVGRVGRVYCVDGLTGGVVWRYTLPPIDIANSSVSTDTEIHSTPAVARFTVLTDPVAGTTAAKLCVVVSDDGGRVYCLDAVGNRDGNTIDPNAGTLANPALAPATPTVGTTNAYWIWRPDQNHVKVINADGTQDDTKPETTFDPAKDMFAPHAFQTASPTVYVDSASKGVIYVGNSNGVLYALDATGVPAYDATNKDISPYLGSARLLNGNGGLLKAPTVKPLWWFSVSGSAAGGKGSAQIESAPAIDSSGAPPYRIYFGSSHELGGTSNYGRIYALSSTGPVAPPNSQQATIPPGAKGYNTSVSAWEFPRGRQIGSAGIRPALGSISGSPVVYRIPGAATTKIYFAANTGSEISVGQTAPTRVSDGATGRVWCITPAAAAATFNWAYPKAIDPNDETAAGADKTAEPTLPIGGFLHATPAVGMVEFPSTIVFDPSTNGGSGTPYTHKDGTFADIKGNRVPMLYVGTAGTDDKAMYALDLYGTPGQDKEIAVYRLDSPNGSSFQSSPALITNMNAASNVTAGTGGNGGMVYCTAGNILYQFSATPLSNNAKTADGTAYQQFARIGVDAIFGNCGPVSSPTLAAADVSDVSTGGVANTTDWLYVGDTTTGLAKGLTPFKQNFGFDPGTYIGNPPPVPPEVAQPALISPTYTLHIHIFDGKVAHPNTSIKMSDENPIGGPLPTFEWGSDAYIRVSNIVPANAGDADSARRVPDPDDPNYYFTNGSPITLQIGDIGATTTANDNGLIPAVNGAPGTSTPAIVLPTDGFYGRGDTGAIDPLIDAGPPATKWFGAYTYAIRDGSGRLNTPGSMRRVTLARQTAEVRSVTGQIVGTVTLQSQIGNGGTDPTFGILNPLALFGAAPTVDNSSPSYGLGSIGPNTANTGTQALANGNTVYSGNIPDNGYSLGGGDPTNPSQATTAATYPTQYVSVATATGEISHGSSGTNGGLLQIADRSALPVTGGSLRIRMEQAPLHWNDPTGLNGAQSTINPLPWESMPISYLAGANRSPDYPDISSNGVNETLLYAKGSLQTNLANSSGLLTVPGKPYLLNNLLLTIHAPKYQPANLTGPRDTMIPVANGYHTRVRVFVDSNQNGQWDSGEAYRDVDLQSGVLADLSTSIVQNTTDIGIVPQGFGVNTDFYTGLGSFLPPGAPFIAGSLPAPYTPGNYAQFFKAVTVHNDGNVNLVNAQFDQKFYPFKSLTAPTPDSKTKAIMLDSESLDATASIPAFDHFLVTGTRQYLVRTSIDHDLVGVTQNPLVVGKYPGDTFHKSRVGDVGPTTLQIPDRSPDDYLPSSDPYISVAVPIGTPAGNYHHILRLFEGMDTATYDWLTGPKYNGSQAGHAVIDQATIPPAFLDGFALRNTNTGPGPRKYISIQPYSEPGTDVKVTVSEARMTGDKIFGEMPMIDDAATPGSGVNYLPSAFRDFYWSGGAPAGTGNVNLVWTSTRATGAPSSAVTADTYTRTLPSKANSKTFNMFVLGSPGSWWTNLGTLNGALFDPTVAANGLNVGMSVAQEPHLYDAANDVFSSSGLAYGFYNKLHGNKSDLYCASLTSALSGVTLGTPSWITRNDNTTPKYGVRGLKVSSNLSGSGIAFNPPAVQSTATAITEDLWSFWYIGARGGSSIQFSATTTNAGAIGPDTLWRNPTTLPVPAGLTSVSDPSAVLIPTSPPQIQVTYTGVSPDGNSDIYVSRYQPYRPYVADPTSATGASIPDNKKLGLLLTPTPSMSEFLQPDPNNQWWQARDVAWLRGSVQRSGGNAPISISGTPLLAPTDPIYDTASGLLVYTGLNDGTAGTPVYTAYIDLARGRIRFRPALPKAASVSATFQSQARRITTDLLAESGATSILDEAFKPNEDGIPGSRVSTGRMWYLYSKTGGAGAGVKPSLYYKTQRLTVDLHDQSNKPISIALDRTNPLYPVPIVTVSLGGVTVYDASTHLVDIDWKRGRLYFPLTINGVSTEGMTADVTFSYYDSAQTLQSYALSRVPVYWLDEDRSTDLKAPSTELLSGGTDSSERAVPMKTVVNEGNVTAFLDPTAYSDVFRGAYDFQNSKIDSAGSDQPHNLWLFWSSSRNGQGDLYSTVLNPRFSSETP